MDTTRIAKATAAAAAAILFFASTSASALTIGVSGAAPTVDGADIASLTLTGTATAKFWSDTRAHGQTFTTGAQDVMLDAITLQTSSAAPATKTYTVRVGTVTGNTFTSILASESGNQTTSMVANDFITYTFATPVLLTANTLFGFDVAFTNSTTPWQSGIPYLWETTTQYTGGAAFSSTANAQGTSPFNLGSRDRIFHLNLSVAAADVPEPATATLALLGLGGLMMRRRRDLKA